MDTYEVFSYCDRARGEAIGAQTNLGPPFVTAAELDLMMLPFGAGGAYSDHNGEFKSHCARDWGFWDAVLESMLLKH